jgi:hypothetical protein
MHARMRAHRHALNGANFSQPLQTSFAPKAHGTRSQVHQHAASGGLIVSEKESELQLALDAGLTLFDTDVGFLLEGLDSEESE